MTIVYILIALFAVVGVFSIGVLLALVMFHNWSWFNKLIHKWANTNDSTHIN
jgi:chromate transport protein ChrA